MGAPDEPHEIGLIRAVKRVADALEKQNELLREQNEFHKERNRTLKENSLPPLTPKEKE